MILDHQGNCFNAIISLIGDIPPDKIFVKLCLDNDMSPDRRIAILDEFHYVIEYFAVIFTKYKQDDRDPELEHFNKISHYSKGRECRLYEDVLDCYSSNTYVCDMLDERIREPKKKVKIKRCPGKSVSTNPHRFQYCSRMSE